MGITVLLPGGFKPPHGGHIQLAKNYAKNPKVDKVLVLVGPKDRDGITREQSVEALELLLKDSGIKVIPTTQESPMGAAFDFLLNPKASGTYALAASSKGSDADRLEMFAKSIEGYKTKPDRDGRTVPKDVKIDTDLKVDIQPMKYKGRNDAYDNTDISATVARKDLLMGDKAKFATNYPGVDRETTDKLFDMFSKTIKEPEEKKSKKKKLKESEAFGRLLEQRAINRLVMMELLKEGGNAIPSSIPVEKADVKDVVKSAIKALPKELRGSIQIDIGSSGYKAQSGDIDIFVDEDAVVEYFGAKEAKDAKKSMQKYFQDAGLESVVSGRNVHIGVPYKDAKAQVDFMVIKDAETVAPWHQHGPRKSYEDPEFKGSEVFILISSIAKSLGLKFDPFAAKLVNRETGELVARNRDEVAKILLNPKATGDDLNSVKSILKALENDPKRDEKLAQAKGDEEKGLVKMTFKESLLKEEGPRIQHPEDLIYWEGSKGAKAALNALTSIDPKTVSVKWDGSPAVVFGYDENGNFVFTDKNAFVAKGYDGKSKSPEELQKMIVDRGARSGKDYSEFGSTMASVFDKAKNSVPKRAGFYTGDMLYFKKPEVKKGNYVFKPNVVTYEVPTNSELGKKIGASEAGVVVHSFSTPDGKTEDVSKTKFNANSGLLVVPPVLASEPPKVDKALVSKASSAVSAASSADKLLNTSDLSAQKMTDLADIMYNYTNNRVEDLNKLSASDFDAFVQSNAKISGVKKAKIAEYVNKYKKDFDNLFNAVKAIAELKNSLIAQLDSKGGDVKASIGNQPGGEGYVISAGGNKIKLVNRGGFTAANRAIQR
jgi:hypothetical protein